MYKTISDLCTEHKHLICDRKTLCIDVAKEWIKQHRVIGIPQAVGLLSQRVDVWLYLMTGESTDDLVSPEFLNRLAAEMEAVR